MDRSGDSTARPEWGSGPRPTRLRAGEVHVWRSDLGLPDWELARLAQTLSAEEKARADRFAFQRLRNAFVASHGALRGMLGLYLDLPPHRIRFEINEYGKPSLAGPAPALHFNMSHSKGVGLFALAGVELGADVEFIRPTVDHLGIAERFFAPGEVKALRSLSGAECVESFYRCWSRKEAFVKAKGAGLSLPLRQFEVSFLAGDRPAVRRTDWDPNEAGRWTMVEASPGVDYSGAVALEGSGFNFLFHTWG